MSLQLFPHIWEAELVKADQLLGVTQGWQTAFLQIFEIFLCARVIQPDLNVQSG